VGSGVGQPFDGEFDEPVAQRLVDVGDAASVLPDLVAVSHEPVERIDLECL
jgi:hypothetical protein